MYREMLELLTDNYNKDVDSNIGKLFKVIGDEIQQSREGFELIKLWKDIDEAEGNVLDRIGNNVLEYRKGKEDVLYRYYIKIKIISNLSQGDIETLNTVAEFLIKDDFIGIEETWQHEIYQDIAGLLIKLKRGFGDILGTNLLSDVLNRVRAGGVKLYWLSEYENTLDLKFANAWRSNKNIRFSPQDLEDIETTNHLYIGMNRRQAKSIGFKPSILDSDISLENRIYPSTSRRQMRYVTIVPDMTKNDISLRGSLIPVTIKASMKKVEIKPITPDDFNLGENINIIGVTKMMNKIVIKEGV